MVADILFVPLVPLFVIALALVLELVEERLHGPDAARSRRGIRRPGHARRGPRSADRASAIQRRTGRSIARRETAPGPTHAASRVSR